MSDIIFLDIALRAAAAGYVLLLCAKTLAADFRSAPAVALRLRLAFASVCVGGFLGVNAATPAAAAPAAISAGAELLSGFAAVSLWLFVRALFRSETGSSALEVGNLALWCLTLLGGAGRLPLISSSAAEFGQLLLAVAMAVHGLAITIGEREGDLVETRRRLRRPLALIATLFLLTDGLVDLILGQNWTSVGYVMIQNTAILLTGAWFVVALEPSRLFDLTAPTRPAPRASSALNETERRLSDKITALIEADQIHLQSDFTFEDFVKATGEREAVVRRYVNHQLGFGHFRQFLNHHRVAAARRLLVAPEGASLKIASIAHDSGFSSIASFNRAFRAAEGCSPRDFKARAALGDGGEFGEKPCFEDRMRGF